MGADGEVSQVQSPGGLIRLDETTVATVRQLHFFPALRNGTPPDAVLRYNFRKPRNEDFNQTPNCFSVASVVSRWRSACNLFHLRQPTLRRTIPVRLDVHQPRVDSQSSDDVWETIRGTLLRH